MDKKIVRHKLKITHPCKGSGNLIFMEEPDKSPHWTHVVHIRRSDLLRAADSAAGSECCAAGKIPGIFVDNSKHHKRRRQDRDKDQPQSWRDFLRLIHLACARVLCCVNSGESALVPMIGAFTLACISAGVVLPAVMSLAPAELSAASAASNVAAGPVAINAPRSGGPKTSKPIW
jgi:hypothetical protein